MTTSEPGGSGSDRAAPRRRPQISCIGTVLALLAGVMGGVAWDTSAALAASSSVTAATVSLSSSAAAAHATYTIGFSTSATGAIAAGGTITLVAPPGTVLPGNNCNDYSLTDLTTSSGSFVPCAGGVSETYGLPGLPIYGFQSHSGAAVTITVPNAINAGDALSLVVGGVVNPAAGPDTLSVSTSADVAPATSGTYAITSAASVTQPSVLLGSGAAGAGSSYTIGFSTSATGAVTAGGTITVQAPTGTLWPGNNCNDYSLTDLTTPSGSFAPCTGGVSETFGRPGLPIFSYASYSGAAVTITVPNAIGAGDSLSLVVSGVVNPAAGPHTLSVSTSADVAPAASSTYTIVSGASVTSPSVALSSSAATAHATYTVGFSTSATGAIAAGGTITLVAPPGTLWPGNNCTDYALTDLTTSSGSFVPCAGGVSETFGKPGLPIFSYASYSGAAVTITVPNAINAGDSLSLVVGGVLNPAAGPRTLSVSTSADVAPAASGTYTVTSAASVSQPAVAPSSSAAGGSSNYTIAFSTSATGAVPAGGTITLAAPTGTTWPGGGCSYALTDVTTSSGNFSCASTVSVAGPSTVTIGVPNSILASDSLSLLVNGVTNPGGGIDTLSVATSSDVVASPSSSYTITGSPGSPTSVASPTLSTTSTAGGAAGVTYTVGFTASASGGLGGGSGSITLAAPAGTIFGACPYGCGGGNATYTITDTTNSSGSGSASPSAFAAGGSVVTVVPANTIQAGDSVTLTITQVVSPPAGAGQLAISTSADQAPVSVADTTTAPGSVSSASLAPTTTAAGAAGVTYSLSFTASASGAVEGGLGSITLAAPAGTIFGACPYGCGGGNATYTITDTTHPSGSGSASPSQIADGGAMVSLTPANTIQAGDSVTLTVTQVLNPPAGSGQLSISTSSDPVAVNAADTTTAAGSVSSVSFGPSSTAGGASGVTYAVGFTASATGAITAGFGSITLAAPAGTIFGPCPYGCGGGNATYTITDTTHPSGSGSASPSQIADGGAMVSLTPANTIQAGDSVLLIVTQVTNPPAGSGQLSVSTSSDPASVSAADTTSPPNAVASADFSPSSAAGGATAVTYTVGFTTSATGTLLGGLGAVSLLAPPGTTFSPSATATITDATHSAGSGTVGSIGVLDGGALADFVVPNTIQAGDAVVLTVPGVTNPPAGAQSLEVSTSSDATPTPASTGGGSGPTVSGTVLASDSSPAVGAAVQACSNGTCALTTTDASGDYQLSLTPGSYILSADAPPGSRDTQGVQGLTVGPTAQTGVTIQLGLPPGIPSGLTLLSPTFGTETSSTTNPIVNWRDPFQVSIAPGFFPSGGVVVATQVVVVGTDVFTGQVMDKVVDIGGDIAGNPVGEVLGTQPITVTVPALEPIHGDISIFVHYKEYASSLGDGTGPPAGIIGPQVIDLNYPNQVPTPTDPLAGYFVNDGAPAGAPVGGGTITGTDAADFSVVPLSSVGVPPGTNDCGSSAVTLQQYDGTSASPAQADECGVGVQFTPPALPDAHKILYYATLEEQANGGTIPVQLVGCDSRVSAAAAAVTGFDLCGNSVMDWEPSADSGDGGGGSGQGGGGGEGGGGGGTGGGGGPYVDPSGTVYGTSGTVTVPLAGATVTLGQGSSTSGPFTAVPNGSTVMSPANRVNPDLTDQQGEFGWDVLSGNYDVTAQASGCTTSSTPGFAVPPPVTNLSLTLNCSTLPTRASTSTGISESASTTNYGDPVTFSAPISGTGTPTGTVTFSDGSTPIGTAVVAGGSAALTVSSLGTGPHSISATYGGDALDSPSSSGSIAFDVTSPQSISFTSTAPSNAVVTGTYTPTAHSTSGLPVALGIDGSSASVCSMTAGVVTFNQTGTCIIDANQAGNTTFAAAAQVQQKVSVAGEPQTISFTSTAPSNAVVTGTYMPTAHSTSGLTVALGIDGSSVSVCSMTAGVITFNQTGICTIDANQAGNTTFAAAAQVQQKVSVGTSTGSKPVAVDDHFSTPIGTTLVVPASKGVLANDTLNGAGIVAHTKPGHGSLTLKADGSFTYAPMPFYFGQDSFTYTLQNGSGTSTATVTIQVGPALSDVAVTLSGPSSARSGSSFAYTFTVTDIGPAAASGVQADLQLPSGAVVTSASGNPTAEFGGTLLAWSAPTLAPGASLTYRVVVTVTKHGGTLVTLGAAWPTGSLDLHPFNNVAQTTTRVS